MSGNRGFNTGYSQDRRSTDLRSNNTNSFSTSNNSAMQDGYVGSRSSSSRGRGSSRGGSHRGGSSNGELSRGGRYGNQQSEDNWMSRRSEGIDNNRGSSNDRRPVGTSNTGRSRWENSSSSTGNGQSFSSLPPPLMQNYQNSSANW